MAPRKQEVRRQEVCRQHALPTTRSTFRTAEERRVARQEAEKLQRSIDSTEPSAKVYNTPDIRVGDTVRIVARVGDWHRRTETVRQLNVDQASGTGSIAVVDPDEAYAHAALVAGLHRTLYSQPFAMPATVPSSMTSPAASPDRSSLRSMSPASTAGDLDDELGPSLPDPSRLSSHRLTETTFKFYLTDYMVCSATLSMKMATRGASDPGLPLLQQVFPEYAAWCGVDPQTQRPALMPSSRGNVCPDPDPATPRPRMLFRSREERERDRQRQEEEATPRGTQVHTSVFPSKAEREASRGSPKPQSRTGSKTEPVASRPQAVFKSKAERERERQERENRQREDRQREEQVDDPFLSDHEQDENDDCPPSSPILVSEARPIEVHTVQGILSDERLRGLAERIVNRQSKVGERELRRRAKAGAATERDKKVIASRLARGRSKGDYVLSPKQLERGMTRLVEWGFRQAASEGWLVHAHVPATGDRAIGYVPLPPQLLGPLLVPVVEMERRRRAADVSRFSELGKEESLDVSCIASRLRQWGEEGRWERVSDRVVEEALTWARERGLVTLSGV